MIMSVSRRAALELLGEISWWGVTYPAWQAFGLEPARPFNNHQGITMEIPNTPTSALDRLLAGNQRFVHNKSLHPHQDVRQLAVATETQTPFAAILSCADARVIPEIIFDQGIGDLFVVRVAGNIAITEEIASEEYAVTILKTPLIVVLGHERCGAVTATLSGKNLPGVMSSLTRAIQPAIALAQREPGDPLTNVIQANVRLQVQRLKNSPLLAQAIRAEALDIVGAYYELASGVVRLLN